MTRTVLATTDHVYDALLRGGDAGVPASVAIVEHGTDRVLLATEHMRPGTTEGVLTIHGATVTFRATGEAERNCDLVRCVGSTRLRFSTPDDREPDSMFDRQVRALCRPGQLALGNLHVGLIGAGGTGSPTFEQLVRLGVGRVTVIDPKIVEDTKLSRVYGSTTADIGRPKAQVMADHATRIGLGTTVKPIVGSVTSRPVAAELRTCDVLFCCTDDHAGRNVASRLAYRYLIPLFNTGVQVRVTDEAVAGVHGRVTVCGPGLPCLSCLGQTIPHQAHAEALNPLDRARLAADGYVPGLADPDPSVVTYTTAMSGLMVSAFVNRMIGFEPSASHQLVTFDRYKSAPQPVQSCDGHYCADGRYVGAGDCEPLLDMLWST